ncbi:hypothetical protein [Rhodopirellula europaea]|uniref:Cadherin domain-containing protein n=1 Tax=Rhodopirellula europaea 6C TaxID=1263867 RepID=M2AAM0_9BACT|nr:hypothetical protein [Rhodopirellula europaea]EMB13590.1 hypothetical protein RE6C_05680 [Rhodopirellula europaea 6C]
MTQRERFLAMAVGGLFVVIAFQWGFNRYRDAIKFRDNRLAGLQNEANTLNEKLLAGAYADRQMGEYMVRSLPSNPERAQSTYQSWLLGTVREAGLRDAGVDPVSDAPVGDLYYRYGFRVSGKTSLDGLVGLLHDFYARDYLHRIRELNFGPSRTGDLNVEMTIDAISLNNAAIDAKIPERESWRVAKSLDETRQAILNRNFFQPPNQPPVYAGDATLVAVKGEKTDVRLKVDDPEGTEVTYELEGELPEWASFKADSGTFTFNPPADPEDGEESGDASAASDKEPLQVVVRMTDTGYPRRQIEKTLVVKLENPPPPKEPDPLPPKFDDATQTYLTALVQGRDDWTAWMNVRTRGETLKLQVGDSFEIGSMKGSVKSVSARLVLLEIGGKEYELRPSGKLSEAVALESPEQPKETDAAAEDGSEESGETPAADEDGESDSNEAVMEAGEGSSPQSVDEAAAKDEPEAAEETATEAPASSSEQTETPSEEPTPQSQLD